MNANTTSQPTQQKVPLLKKLLGMLSLTKERELTCAEVFELMDYYAELEAADENVRALMPQVTQHFRICPECAEEYKALQKVMGEGAT